MASKYEGVVCCEPGCENKATTRNRCRNCYAKWYQREKKKQLAGEDGSEMSIKKNETIPIARATCRIWNCGQPEHHNYLCKEHADQYYHEDWQ